MDRYNRSHHFNTCLLPFTLNEQHCCVFLIYISVHFVDGLIGDETIYNHVNSSITMCSSVFITRIYTTWRYVYSVSPCDRPSNHFNYARMFSNTITQHDQIRNDRIFDNSFYAFWSENICNGGSIKTYARS